MLAISWSGPGFSPQRELGGLQDGPGQQAGFCAALRALAILAPLNPEGRVGLPSADRTDEPRALAGALQRRLALRLGAVEGEKLRQRLAWLKLDCILGRRGVSAAGGCRRFSVPRWLKT
jgi:hypothetical protein